MHGIADAHTSVSLYKVFMRAARRNMATVLWYRTRPVVDQYAPLQLRHTVRVSAVMAVKHTVRHAAL